jgi:hypothetical protein
VFLVACLSDEKEKTGKDRYANYFISGEEGKEFVTVFLQFSNGPEDIASVLKEPEKVFFDNQLLTADSARESGAFYEIQLPLDEFTGNHTIRYLDENQEEYTEEFSFLPFRVTNLTTSTVKRGNMVLNMEGLTENDVIRVVMTDTSMEGDGVNELDSVVNGQLDLREFLLAVANGPLILHLFKEEDRSLKTQNGRISITYGLKKEFELKD